MDWYQLSDPGSVDTPALLVYPQRVKENIRLAIGMTGSPDRLRPHVKTHKSPDLTRLQLAAGITRFKCATIAEAEMLALESAPDVLLAYQPIGPKAHRLARLIRSYPSTKFSCLIENPAAALAMAAVFEAAGVTVPVYLDLNVGMDRTGISPDEQAVELFRLATQTPGITPVGLHAYDGHIRATDLTERTRQCDEGFAKVLALRTRLQAVGSPSPASPLQLLAVIAGGSPTFPIHARREAVVNREASSAFNVHPASASTPVQCSPGTFVYWDKGYADSFPDQPFQPAALVLTRVISLRGDSRLCLDLGHKSIAAENDLGRRVFFLNGPDLKPVGQSEEHLVVEAGAGHGYSIGHIFYGMPYHVCPTIALYDHAHTIEGGRLTGTWNNIARNRTIDI